LSLRPRPGFKIVTWAPSVGELRHHWNSVCQITLAAPEYFKPATIDGDVDVDGGLGANSPVILFIRTSLQYEPLVAKGFTKLENEMKVISNHGKLTEFKGETAKWLIWMIESSWEFGMLWRDSFLGFFALTRLQGILMLKVLYYDSKAQEDMENRLQKTIETSTCQAEDIQNYRRHMEGGILDKQQVLYLEARRASGFLSRHTHQSRQDIMSSPTVTVTDWPWMRFSLVC
jgi:hypothetical protein